MPLPLLIWSSWNSAIFASIPTYEYRVVFATLDFQSNNQSWASVDGFDFNSLRLNAPNLEFLDRADCVNRYLQPLNAGKDVIVVTKRTTAENYNRTMLVSEVTGGLSWYFEEYWICSSRPTWLAMGGGGCTSDVIDPFISNWAVAEFKNSTNFMGNGAVPVDHCLSGGINPSQEMCSVGFSSYIMFLVVVVNALKCGLVGFTAWKTGKLDAIVTLGDAISSFLREPDHQTEKMCLSTKRSFTGKANWQPQAHVWQLTKLRWVHSVTKRRFGLTVSL